MIINSLSKEISIKLMRETRSYNNNTSSERRRRWRGGGASGSVNPWNRSPESEVNGGRRSNGESDGDRLPSSLLRRYKIASMRYRDRDNV